ncbi:uncharacterized protein [Ptychodera flava]|uniref:uncharacterized protein n=1 Tax=Ptychodera flava TaxID=63121 RepID=UPI00396A311B
MEEISYLVENCVADEDAYPLSYQIFRIKDHDNKMEAITTKGSEPSSTGVGKSARDGTSNNTFVAKVCDKFSCAEFSVDIDVDVKVSFSATDIADFRTNQIEPLEYQGAYLEALVNTNMLLVKTASSSRRRKRSYADTTTADEQGRLDLIQNVLSSTVLSEDDAPLLIDQIGNFITSDMAIGDQDTFLDIMKEVVTIYSSDADTVIDTENARILLEKLHDIGSGMDPVWNSAMLDKCRKGQARMLKSLSRGQTLGGGATQIASSGVTVSIEKNVLDGSFSSAGGATIDFGSELQNMYTAAWSCDSGTCSGVSVKTQHYDTGVDYRSTTDEDKNSRAADVISVELSDPESDETLNITDLATPIKMNLTINSPDGTKLYTCKYWDEDTGAWSTDGVTTVEIDSSTVECQMNHLSEFSAFSSDPPSTVLPSTAAVTVPASTESLTTLAVAAPLDSTGDNTGIIIGAVVGAIAVIVVAVIIAIVMIKKAKKPAKNIEDGRSDTDTVSPRKIDHVRVETKTPEAKTPRSTATNDPTYAAVSGLSPAYPPNDPYSSVTKAEIAAFSAHTSSSNDSTTAATANQKAQLAETLPTMDEFLASQGATTKKEPTYEGSLFKEPTVVSEAGKTDATTFRAKSVTKARPGSGLTVVSVDGISEDSALPESRPSSTSRSTSVTTHHM